MSSFLRGGALGEGSITLAIPAVKPAEVNRRDSLIIRKKLYESCYVFFFLGS